MQQIVFQCEEHVSQMLDQLSATPRQSLCNELAFVFIWTMFEIRPLRLQDACGPLPAFEKMQIGSFCINELAFLPGHLLQEPAS